ncbi:MAG: sulfatase [Isosphaeraceae bacterium]
MDPTPPAFPDRPAPPRMALTPSSAVLLAIALGLCGGYLDVGFIVLKRFLLNPEGYYRSPRDFPWTVPLGHAALLVIPGLLIALASWLSRGRMSVFAGVWLMATLAMWSALLRLPIHAAGSLLLAAGIGRQAALMAPGLDPRRTRALAAGVVVVLAAFAAGTSGWDFWRERRAVSALTAPPLGARARNVVLVVWDTVRAYNLGSYGYPRPTTPNLDRWMRRGVMYSLALAPAPWTYPSHTSLLTGQWPLRLDTQWKMKLETADSTLAEYLASRGYHTAGFVGNTNCCTYESRLDRGFLHYEDYTLTPWSLLTRTVAGDWIARKALRLTGLAYLEKWVGLQARDASAINRAFFDWLDHRRRGDRPFFAFLNEFDAHEPYIPSDAVMGRFGMRPRTARERSMLLDFVGIPRPSLTMHDVSMARDCYDDCIAELDRQLGRLLDELGRRGLLADTDVIVTSDHGEAFGNHGRFGHAHSVLFEEVGVPLVILSAEAPPGRVVAAPVSLSDIPATVVDRLGLAEGSPFPGRSLAAGWRGKAGSGSAAAPPVTPAFSEQASRHDDGPQAGPGGLRPGFQMSLVAGDRHYIRDGLGRERLFDLAADPFEMTDIRDRPERRRDLESLRRGLLGVLSERPGSAAVERVYLQDFRRALEAAIAGEPGPRGARVTLRPSRPDD